MIDAIEKEILQTNSTEEINSIYFGGGTPGILETGEIKLIIEAVRKNFTVNTNAEITLETNPDDINSNTLEAWLKIGINRLSIGIQSFNDDELRWMNRAHNAAKSINCLRQINDAGFINYSADLIYGSPKQTLDILQKNIDVLLSFDVPHISSYALTIEEKTLLHKRILQGKEANVDSGLQSEMFYHLVTQLQDNNIEQYEISNFSKPGFRSRHNSSYWKGEAYVGIGPSAHSYDGVDKRSWNVADNKKYIEGIENNESISESEWLTPTQQRNEMIMLGLRTTEGVDLNKFEKLFGENKRRQLLRTAEINFNKRKIILENDFLKLTSEGKFFADGIAADLFEI